MDIRKPILVTGSHRSGTTWVGKMLSLSPEVAYIREPFHPSHRFGVCNAKFNYWFTYINDKNESLYLQDIARMLEFKYNLKREIKSVRSPSHIIRMVRDYYSFSKSRNSNLRPLLKDPIALFSAEWLYKTFNMDVVVLIRHPAAFASSLKRMKWTHPFSDFLDQKLLIEDILHPFEDEILKFAKDEQDIIDQAILLWRLVYYIVSQYKKKYKNWIFLKHEDISRAPLHYFELLFNRLNLEFTSKVKKVIMEYSSPKNPKDIKKKSDSIKRHSRANIWNWKTRLTKAEINIIKEKVGDIAETFYSDKDW
ncbi:MAG: sulfotransferase [Candidatus Hermodarchaeota archaeon]